MDPRGRHRRHVVDFILNWNHRKCDDDIFDDYAQSRTSTTRVEGGKRPRDKETAATVLRRENGPLVSPSLSASLERARSGPFLSPREVDIGGGELRR